MRLKFSLSKLIIFIMFSSLIIQSNTNKSVIDLIMNNMIEGNPKEAFKVWHYLYKQGDYDLNTEEALRKYLIFKENLKDIIEHNKNPDKTWKKGVNQFSDLTKEEFINKISVQISKENTMENYFLSQNITNIPWNDFRAQVSYYGPNDITVYKPIDWINKCGQVWNQWCGSCVAHSVSAAIECNYNLKYGSKIVISRQQAYECFKGCLGGSPDITSLYYYSYGIYLNSDYPEAIGQIGSCKMDTLSNKGIKPKSILTGYETLCYPLIDKMRDCRVKAAAYKVLQKGPFATALDANVLFNYGSGIVDGSTCKSVNHSVLVIGFGNDPLIGDYWVFRNSWGDKWGENGNFRMKAGPDNKSTCFIYGNIVRPQL